MKIFRDITTNLDALKLKEYEKKVYDFFESTEVEEEKKEFIIPKPIIFKGINTDMAYISDNRLLFIKFMDTTEELFSFLDQEILEIMKEEKDKLSSLMNKNYPNIYYNYIFIMSSIEGVEDKNGLDDFIDNNVVFKGDLDLLLSEKFEKYFFEENGQTSLELFLYNVCSEYFTMTNGICLNEKIRKLTFSNDSINYSMCLMEDEQIAEVSSANYGNHAILGGSGSGKTTILLGRLIKLSKIYPHHKFLFLTFTKQQANKCKEILDLLKVDTENIFVHTYSSFIFKIAKLNNLVVNHSVLKMNFDKAFSNIMKQVDNSVKNKNIFKGIFIDEGENFSEDELSLIHKFLYKHKFIFNISICKAYNINNNLNIYKCKAKVVDYEDELLLRKNYRQDKNLVEYINCYCDNCNEFISNIRSNLSMDIFSKTETVLDRGGNVSFVNSEVIDDQINSVVWELNHLVSDLGYRYEDIAIVYPYNKKKLKNGKVIYFQYMLRKNLENSGIEFVFADDILTDISPKTGLTISNIYSVKSLSFKAIILCELEMLYNHVIHDESQDYQINDFVGDLNKVYTAMTRAENYLSIVSSYTEKNSDIIKLLSKSMNDVEK